MIKKVNTEAVVSAVLRQSMVYHRVTCEQYKTIIYINPGTCSFNVDEIIAISVRLTGRWNEATVTTDIREAIIGHEHLQLIVSVDSLLPEFVVEGEEYTEDEN